MARAQYSHCAQSLAGAVYRITDLAAGLRQMLGSSWQPTTLLADKWLGLSERTVSVVHLHGCLPYKIIREQHWLCWADPTRFSRLPQAPWWQIAGLSGSVYVWEGSTNPSARLDK